jgi:hypothetical protein
MPPGAPKKTPSRTGASLARSRASSARRRHGDALDKFRRQNAVALFVYAGLLSDQDTRDAAHQGMQQELIQLYTQFGATASFSAGSAAPAGGTVDNFLPRTAPRDLSLLSEGHGPPRSAHVDRA